MEWKPLPVGIDDFEKIVTGDYFYVDKTLFIKELLEIKGEVNLFTRPRRQWFPFHKKRLPSQGSFILLPLERRRKTASGKCHQHKSLFSFSHRKYSDQ